MGCAITIGFWTCRGGLKSFLWTWKIFTSICYVTWIHYIGSRRLDFSNLCLLPPGFRMSFRSPCFNCLLLRKTNPPKSYGYPRIRFLRSKKMRDVNPQKRDSEADAVASLKSRKDVSTVNVVRLRYIVRASV